MELGLEIANRDRYRNRQINRNALKIITQGFTKAVIINPCYRYRDRGSQRLWNSPEVHSWEMWKPVLFSLSPV